jgi:hypothetical protein
LHCPRAMQQSRITIHQRLGRQTSCSAAGSVDDGRAVLNTSLRGDLGSGLRRLVRWLGLSSACAGGFRQEPGNEVEPPLHPRGERVISCEACGLDTNEAGQHPAGELHRPHVGLAQCRFTALSATRTISAAPVMPQHMLPLTRNDRPAWQRTTLSPPGPGLLSGPWGGRPIRR